MWILKFSLSLLRTVDRAVDVHRSAPPVHMPSGAPAPEQGRREHASTGAAGADAAAHQGSRAGCPSMPVTEAEAMPAGRTVSGASDASARAELLERLAAESRGPKMTSG